MKPYKTILLAYEEELAILTINRPEILNALSSEVLLEIDDALDQVAANEAVQALIITGAGAKAFVAGANIKDFVAMTPIDGYNFSRLGNDVFYKLDTLRMPTIAAINGYALGGGCELALACDIRIAAENAVLGQPEVGLGIPPGFGGSQRLPRLVPAGIAKELIYTGRNVKADEAKQIGLVNKVVSLDQLLVEAKDMAKRIAKNAPLAVEKSKQLINQGLSLPLEQALELEAQGFALLFATEDQKIGSKAFVNKEKASFKRS